MPARDDRARTPRSVRAIPPPRPPSVNAGRTMQGRPSPGSACERLGRRLVAIALRAASRRPARASPAREAARGPRRRRSRRVGADQLDAERSSVPSSCSVLGEVERGLAAERRQQRVGALALDHLRDRPGQQRLDVGGVGELRVGHDRRRVGVDEHDLVALLPQDLAGLHAGVVELGGLTDHDRPGAEDQDLADVVAPRHQAPPALQEAVEQVAGCRAVRGRPRGGTGRRRRAPRAARGPRRCGRRG